VLAPEELLEHALALAGTIAAAPRAAVLETKRRIILERDAIWGPLFDREQEVFREALFGT
jgi:enoyl-CoA hydratase/carnithine racemase